MLREKTAPLPERSTPACYAGAWWLIPRPFDLVSSLMYLGVLLPFLYSFIRHSGYIPLISWWQVALMLGSVTLLLGIDRLEFYLYGERAPLRRAVVLLIARIALIEVIGWLDRFQYSPFLYLIVLFLGCLYFGNGIGYALGLLALIVYAFKHSLSNPGWLSNGTELHYLVLFIVGCTFAITIARVVAREQASRARSEELLLELEYSHRQLQDYAGQVAELATTRERNRVAREIHDSLGHYLTVINVQLEKAQAFRAKKPSEAEQAVSDAKRLASEALQDVRRSVSALRTTNELLEIFPAVRNLVENMQSEQTPITLNIEGNDASYSPNGLLTLYRAAQEGLTNIQKHANASHVWLDLKLDKQEATLCLRDNGHGFDVAHVQKGNYEQGYGLRGVQERLELVGGSFFIESIPNQGTTLLIKIPKNPTVAESMEKKEVHDGRYA